MLKVMLIGIALLGCKAFVSQNENDLVLLRATRQSLYAGTKGGGITTEYNITLEAGTNQPLKFDSVWINNQRFSVGTLKEGAHHPSVHMNSEDTLLLVFSAYTKEPEAKKDKQIEAHPPVSYKGAALLRYYQDNKPKYLVVQDFFELEPIYAP